MHDSRQVSDLLYTPPLVPCIHHWIIREQSDGQSLGTCKKCGKHKSFSNSHANFNHQSPRKVKAQSDRSRQGRKIIKHRVTSFRENTEDEQPMPNLVGCPDSTQSYPCLLNSGALVCILPGGGPPQLPQSYPVPKIRGDKHKIHTRRSTALSKLPL